MRLRRSLALSLRALFAHRIRAMLALASISAGVAAVVLTGAIGIGIERNIQSGVDALGMNLLVVRSAEVRRFVARSEVKGSVKSLTLQDLEAIAALPAVAHAAPGIDGPARVKVGVAAMNTKVFGTTPEYPAVRRFEIQQGRFFDEADDRDASRVAVLGARVAETLFEGDPVGQQILVRRVPFDVIGVLAPKGALADGDEDNQVFVPVRTALRRVLNVSWLNVIFVSVRDPGGIAEAEAEIRELLTRRHRVTREGKLDFEIQNPSAFFSMQQRTASTLRALTSGLGGIALVVGGTGVMALMLLSVRERTSEIGLRMAVGARPRDILLQFLLESSALALGGWIGGVLIGAAGSVAVAASTTWPVAAPADAIVMSLAMAVTIGLGFGAVPARAASRIPPMRALLAA
jgi:putative ABC transport system permease protein